MAAAEVISIIRPSDLIIKQSLLKRKYIHPAYISDIGLVSISYITAILLALLVVFASKLGLLFRQRHPG